MTAPAGGQLGKSASLAWLKQRRAELVKDAGSALNQIKVAQDEYDLVLTRLIDVDVDIWSLERAVQADAT